MKKLKIGVVDTTFSRVDMAKIVIREIKKIEPSAETVRITVPGIKDLPGAAHRLIKSENCDGVITLGWVGKNLVDKLSYVVSSLGLIMVQIIDDSIVIDVTVHEDEATDDKTLKKIAEDRAKKHARNLIYMVKDPRYLEKYAGKGLRQGYPGVGPIE